MTEEAKMADGAADYGRLRQRLLEGQAQWMQRFEAIQRDRRRESQPLVQDSKDQAIQRENDETLDALDVAGRRELEAIGAALERIEAGSYGRCTSCDEVIRYARLEALPTAATCSECASDARR